MPNYLIAAGLSAGVTQNASLTRYIPPIGYSSLQAGEAMQQLLSRDTYTLSILYVYVSANTLTGATTVRSRINGANGNQSVSIPAGTTGAFTDAVNSDNLVNGDLFCTQSVTGTGVSITYTIISYILSTAANTTPILASAGWNSQPANITRYYSIVGSIGDVALESVVYYLFRVAATLSNLAIYISVNGVTANSTLVIRINAAPGNQSVTIPAGLTGRFEDAVNTDNIAIGQNVNYQLTTGATGTSLDDTSVQIKSNSAGRQVAVAEQAAGAVLAFGQTTYMIIEGRGQSWNAVEADIQVTARASFSGRNMYVNITQNSLDGATTFRMRKNGANGNMVVTVGAGLTGQFEDVVNTDTFVAADLLNWQVITGGSSGSINMACTGFELRQPTAPALGSKSAHMTAKMVGEGLV